MTTQTQDFLQWHIGQWDRRLRLKRTITWLPRILLAATLVVLAFAAISWLRPWLLPSQIAQIAIAAIGGSFFGTLLVIWLLPRSIEQAVRDYDLRFDLKQRLTTALELTRGQIVAPAILSDRQIEDTRLAANNVPFQQYLPLTVNKREVFMLVLALGLLILSLVMENPHVREIEAERALDNRIADQIEALEDLEQNIENNPNLTDAEKDQLTQPLDEAIESLDNQAITEEEAVATLAEAEQELRDLSDGLSEEERAANEQAGNQLSSSPLTDELGEEMGDSDLNNAANESEELGDDLNDLNESEQQEVADQLEEAAETLRETNPEVAENLQEAADALREGDTERAEQALNDAAEALREQQQENQDSEQAQAANDAANEVAEARENVLNNEPQSSEANQQQQDGSSQQGEEGQQNEQGQQNQTGEQPGEGQDGESQQQPGNQPGEEANQQGNLEGEQPGGEGSEGPQGEQPGGDPQSAPGEGQQPGEQGQAPSTGEGESGGSGAGDSGGQTGQTSGGSESSLGNTDNQPGDDEMGVFDSIFSPSRLGGEDGVDVNLDGVVDELDSEPLEEGDINEDFEGESTVPYNEVFRQYEQSVRDALERDYIPIGVRDVIRSYFSSLEP